MEVHYIEDLEGFHEDLEELNRWGRAARRHAITAVIASLVTSIFWLF